VAERDPVTGNAVLKYWDGVSGMVNVYALNRSSGGNDVSEA
jgi:hypothetical protein